jgi:hypothetical protein
MNTSAESLSVEGSPFVRAVYLASFIGSGIIFCAMASALIWGEVGYEGRAIDPEPDLRQPVLAYGALTVASQATQRPSMTYFLVSTLEQHDIVMAEQAVIAGRVPAGEQEQWFAVLLAGTLEQEKEAWDSIEAAKSHGLRCCQSLRSIDLRK